jgi:nitrate reductase gamma subunit
LYFDRNLSQINYIFWLSVAVMSVGFVLILYGMSRSLVPPADGAASTPGGVTPAVIGGTAGVITEFIGATFLWLYRSTIQQASTYTITLERIHAVGMAMQILDTISAESVQLRDSTKADIVRALLAQATVDKRVIEEAGNKPPTS